MRRIFVAALAAGALLGAGASPAISHERAAVATAKPCSTGYTHGVIGGSHKCLRRGQYCARARDREYHRYGYHCHKRDVNGSYHLT